MNLNLSLTLLDVKLVDFKVVLDFVKYIFKLITFVLDTLRWNLLTLVNIFPLSYQHQRGAGSTRENLRKWGRKDLDGKCDEVFYCLNNVIYEG